MGDTDGAFDWALQDLDIIGDISDANTAHAGFNGNAGLDGSYDGQIVRYDYTFGDISFSLSVELDDQPAAPGDLVFGIGGKYSGDLGGVDLGVGLGYQSNGVEELVGISVDALLDNGLRGILNFTSYSEPRPDESHLGIGLFYDMDALSVGVNYGVYEQRAGGHISGYGLAVNYDLGGGAVVQFGFGSSTPPGGPTTEAFSLGVAMSF